MWSLLAAALWVNGMAAAVMFQRKIGLYLNLVLFRRWEYHPNHSHSGMEAATGLAALAIAQLVTFAVYLLRESDPSAHPKFAIGAIYGGVALVPLAGFAAIIWGRVVMPKKLGRLIGRPIHAYDAATVCFSMWNLAAFFVLTAYTLTSYSQETFPTQLSPKDLTFLGAELTEFRDASEAHKVTVRDPKIIVSYELALGSVPDPVMISILGSSHLPAGWRVFDAAGSSLSGKLLLEQQPYLESAAGEKPARIIWPGLSGGRRYRLDVILHGNGDSPSGPLLAKIKQGDFLSAKAYTRD